jgi:hypothetical protein
MKRILFLFLTGFLCNLLFSQDIIVKRNGDELKSRVLEITSESIKYKEFEFQDGPIRNIKVSEVFMIIYENGKRESFVAVENKNPNQVAKPEVPVVKEVPVKRYKGNYFMLGTGVGNSYGGIGLKAQARFGGKTGLGIHAGAGYLPEADKILASAGLKFFPYKGLYINTQFGLIAYESTYYYDSRYGVSSEGQYLWGPSFLIGLDQVWGRKVGFGFNTGLGISLSLDHLEPMLAFDLGFLIRF